MSSNARPPAARRRASASGSVHGHPPRAPWWGGLVWLVPSLVVVVLYAGTLAYAFVWDDLDLIVRNAALQGPEWARLLTSDFWASTGGGTGMWRPVVTASYRVDGVLSGWQPWAFHLVNVLAHAVATALLMRLARARGLASGPAFAAGLLYATAPALSEAVAWIAGRTDAFVALGTFAALLFARRLRTRGDAGSRLGLVAATAFALLSKETALVLPLVVLADSAMPGTPAARRPVWEPVAWCSAVTLLWAVAHRAVVPGSAHPPDPGAWAGAPALALAHLAWLSPLAAHAPLLPEWSVPAPPWVWAAWGALALWTVAVLAAFRRRSEWTLPLVLLVAPLLPVAGASLLETGARFAERALVLPAAGWALACATLATGVPAAQRRLVATLLALLVCLQGLAATRAIGAWRDEESRIRRIAEVRPDDPDAVLGMADLLSAQGRTEEAARWLARADSLPGAGVAVLAARATAAFRGGATADALAAAEAALALAPDDLGAGVVRVRALVRLGRVDEAVAAGEGLAHVHPGAPAAGGALGVAYLAAGRVPEARERLAAASAVLLEDAGLAWDLGRAAIASGDVPLARTAFERAVAAEPGFVEAWLGVADTRARLGDRTGAEAALARVEGLVGASDPRLVALRARIGGR